MQSILLTSKLNFKKNLVEKYFFIMEKNNFEKKSRKIFRKFSIFSIGKSIFPSKNFTWNFHLKINIFRFSIFLKVLFFWKSFFSMMKKYFWFGFFLKFKCLISAVQKWRLEQKKSNIIRFRTGLKVWPPSKSQLSRLFRRRLHMWMLPKWSPFNQSIQWGDRFR